MKPRIQIGDSVEILTRDGRQRIGTIQRIEYGAITVLIGGAEGQATVTIDSEKFRSAGPSLWHVDMGPSSSMRR
jgi:hypothetical protein